MMQQRTFHPDLRKFASDDPGWEAWTSRWHFDTQHLASSDMRAYSGSTTTTANIHKDSWRRSDWQTFYPYHVLSSWSDNKIHTTHHTADCTTLNTAPDNYSSSCLACPCLQICNNYRSHIRQCRKYQHPTLKLHNEEKWKPFSGPIKSAYQKYLGMF